MPAKFKCAKACLVARGRAGVAAVAPVTPRGLARVSVLTLFLAHLPLQQAVRLSLAVQLADSWFRLRSSCRRLRRRGSFRRPLPVLVPVRLVLLDCLLVGLGFARVRLPTFPRTLSGRTASGAGSVPAERQKLMVSGLKYGRSLLRP